MSIDGYIIRNKKNALQLYIIRYSTDNILIQFNELPLDNDWPSRDVY